MDKIQPDEVHIWSACLPECEQDMSYYGSILSKDEQERANTFKFSKDRKQFIMTRGILRCLLSNYLSIPPQSIEILYGLWGKPCLSQEYTLRFNVSHSGDYALYAVTLNFEVGIDLEHINNKLELKNMAKTLFAISELAYWKSLNPKKQQNYFFKSWACKEAFLKALGKGWLGRKDERILREEASKYPYCFDFNPEYVSVIYAWQTH